MSRLILIFLIFIPSYIFGQASCTGTYTINTTLLASPPSTTISISGNTLNIPSSGFPYEWYVDGVLQSEISNSFDISLIPDGNHHDIWVVQIGGNGCNISSDTFQLHGVGISESDLSLIKVYPNPSSNFIVVDGLKNTDDDLFICDILGRMVLQIPNYSNQSLDIRKLEKGIYEVHVINNKVKKVIRFIKE